MPETITPEEMERRIQAAMRAERDACMRIVEECYAQMSHGHGASADTMAREIIRRIAAR